MSAEQLKTNVRRGVFERVVRGVYRVNGSVPTWHQHVMAAVLAAGPGAAASGSTAARLWRLPGFGEGRVNVTQTRRPSRRFAVPGVSEHSSRRLRSQHVRVVDGIPVTSLERTILDLSGQLSAKRTDRVVKDAVGRGLTTITKLAVVLAELGGRGRAGTLTLRSILGALTAEPPTESELEDLVLAVLTAAGLELPHRQIKVGGTTAPIGRIDFLYRAAGVVIEADSRTWHGNWIATKADHRRDAKLTAVGFHVIRTDYGQLIEEPELFIAAIRGALKRAAA